MTEESDTALGKENTWLSLERKNNQLKQNTETKAKVGKTFSSERNKTPRNCWQHKGGTGSSNFYEYWTDENKELKKIV